MVDILRGIRNYIPGIMGGLYALYSVLDYQFTTQGLAKLPYSLWDGLVFLGNAVAESDAFPIIEGLINISSLGG